MPHHIMIQTGIVGGMTSSFMFALWICSEGRFGCSLHACVPLLVGSELKVLVGDAGVPLPVLPLESVGGVGVPAGYARYQ